MPIVGTPWHHRHSAKALWVARTVPRLFQCHTADCETVILGAGETSTETVSLEG